MSTQPTETPEQARARVAVEHAAKKAAAIGKTVEEMDAAAKLAIRRLQRIVITAALLLLLFGVFMAAMLAALTDLYRVLT